MIFFLYILAFGKSYLEYLYIYYLILIYIYKEK